MNVRVLRNIGVSNIASTAANLHQLASVSKSKFNLHTRIPNRAIDCIHLQTVDGKNNHSPGARDLKSASTMIHHNI